MEGPEVDIPELKLFCKEEWANTVENYAEKIAENIHILRNESIHCFKGLISIYKWQYQL